MSSVSTFAIVSWLLYLLGVCLIASRIVYRRIALGAFARLQHDDWLMIFVLIPFTATIVSANQVSAHGKTEWGLKMRFALEEFQVTTTWLVKACLVILYRRVLPSATTQKQGRLLTAVAALCVVTYLIIQILLPIWCRPAKQYFETSSTNPQCITYHNQTITVLVLTLTTTLAVHIFPIPFIPTPRKYLLATLFLLGLFLLTTTILACYYILTQPQTSTTYLLWYTLETTTTITFANLPFLSSLVTTTPERIRRLSNNANHTLSLSQWPTARSVCVTRKDTESWRHMFDRLDSVATTNCTSVVSSSSREERGEVEVEAGFDFWSDEGITPELPPMAVGQVHTLSLMDPPPELEGYRSRRLSLKLADAEKAAHATSS